MLTLAALEHFTSRDKLCGTAEKYVGARRMLLDITRDNYADLPDVAGKKTSGIAAFAAVAGIDACHQLIASPVAMAEGAVTPEEMLARFKKADLTKPGERESLMRWIEHQRGPDAKSLDDVLEWLAAELEIGPVPPWPAHADGTND